MALIPAPIAGPTGAEMPVAKAKVLRLAGAHEEAGDCLRRALDIYTERRVVPFAERAVDPSAPSPDSRRPRAQPGFNGSD